MVRVYPFIGSRKTFTITFQTPEESLLSTPETLPTTEPATPQVRFTLDSEKFPVISPKPYSVKYIAVVYAAGKFTTAGTLYWRMKKNAASVATGSTSVPTNNFYTVNAWFLDVAPGDVLEISLWSSVSDSNWDYKAYFIYPTRFLPFNPLGGRILYYDVRLTNDSTTHPTLTLGNPIKWNPNYPFRGEIEGQTPYAWYIHTYGTVAFRYISPNTTLGLWRIWCHGDGGNPNTAVALTSATYRPYYYSNYLRMTTICRALRVE